RRDRLTKNYGLEPDIVMEMSSQEEAKLIKFRLGAIVSADDDEDTEHFVDIQLERAVKFLSDKK
ncbi:MAG: hypothetical protein QME51_10940, partial [Planctomycetota bacterium]|nr:hypothetical protein [Planctomycetota bacterium]